MENIENGLILGLDVSTKTIGIALYEDLGDKGKLELLNHVTPKIKPVPETKLEELFQKVRVFEEEFLNKYVDLGITRVIIEEPLMRSNNINTVSTLLRFNGMISMSVYQTLGIVPDFISSYDARKYGFPQLMAKRTHNKKGEPYPEKHMAKAKEVLFGAHPWDVDKKMIIWELVSDLEPQINWLYTRNNTLRKEVFDMTDAVACTLGFMHKIGKWSPENLD